MNKFLLLLAFIFATATAAAADYKEGDKYIKLNPVPPQGTGDVVEVVEFFMYTCPHCEKLEPAMNKWLADKPENVEFVRVPAMFGGVANLHAKAFYALEIMGDGERLHEPLFHAIHDQKRKLRSQAELEEFLQEQNVDMDKFRAAMSSFTVQTKANRAAALMQRYGVRGVPSLVVDGRYRSGNAQGYDELIKVVDYLIAKVRKERMSVSAAK